MNVNNVILKAVAVAKKQYPADEKPEIAFVGRSNVGKSSLINTLVNRKALARTSQNPGKTRTINFYEVENQLYFVDLPGYGYAKHSRSESEKWGKMIESYLLQRPQLKNIFFLLDIRHEPSANDQMMYQWLRHYQYKMTIILTKSDKLTRTQLPKNKAMIKKALQLPEEVGLIPFSCMDRSGKEEIWSTITKIVKDEERTF